MNKVILSICIPSFNRTLQLAKLLDSIDLVSDEVEIIVCEDRAPNRDRVKEIVLQKIKNSSNKIYFFENEVNLGFDGNIRRLVSKSSGHFVLFMGDDDLFIPKALGQYVEFLKKHLNKSYVLRSYISIHEGGVVEKFLYLPSSRELPRGEATVAWIFKRSVNISGFTISRNAALKFETNILDGTLLYQVYLACCACMEGESIYCDIPVSIAMQSFRQDAPMFGNAASEKSRFTPGSVSITNSINFCKAYFEVSEYFDKKFDSNITDMLRVDLSKYSYPLLSIQRKRGVSTFLRYAKYLEIDLQMGCTLYFYIYKWALLILGERISDKIIVKIKKIYGYTPQL